MITAVSSTSVHALDPSAGVGWVAVLQQSGTLPMPARVPLTLPDGRTVLAIAGPTSQAEAQWNCHVAPLLVDGWAVDDIDGEPMEVDGLPSGWASWVLTNRALIDQHPEFYAEAGEKTELAVRGLVCAELEALRV